VELGSQQPTVGEFCVVLDAVIGGRLGAHSSNSPNDWVNPPSRNSLPAQSAQVVCSPAQTAILPLLPLMRNSAPF
jgi:hypothetical protein